MRIHPVFHVSLLKKFYPNTFKGSVDLSGGSGDVRPNSVVNVGVVTHGLVLISVVDVVTESVMLDATIDTLAKVPVSAG